MTGVWCSETSLDLAVSMAGLGRRVALLDGELSRPQLSKHCGLDPEHGLSDILVARRGIHEVIVPGPSGTQFVSGGKSANGQTAWTAAAIQRLIEQLGELERHVDLVILHVGTQMRAMNEEFWTAADILLLVTKTTSDSIMNAYSALKQLRDSTQQIPRVHTIVTAAPSEQVALEIHQRLQTSCDRFLGLAITNAGTLLETSQPPTNLKLGMLAATLSETLDGLGERMTARAA